MPKRQERKHKQYVNGLSADERIGIVSPTYYFGLPPIVTRFIQQIKVQQPPYLYFVATCGAMSGWTSGYARLALKRTDCASTPPTV